MKEVKLVDCYFKKDVIQFAITGKTALGTVISMLIWNNDVNDFTHYTSIWGSSKVFLKLIKDDTNILLNTKDEVLGEMFTYICANGIKYYCVRN